MNIVYKNAESVLNGQINIRLITVFKNISPAAPAASQTRRRKSPAGDD